MDVNLKNISTDSLELVYTFLEDYVEEVNANKWDIIYPKWLGYKEELLNRGISSLRGKSLGGISARTFYLSLVLLSAYINPLEYMKAVPEYFLFGAFSSGIREIIIPDNITKLRGACFADSGVKKIYFGKNVEYLDRRCFSNTGLVDIYFDGTKEEFLSIGKSIQWKNSSQLQIHCTDQTFEVDG